MSYELRVLGPPEVLDQNGEPVALSQGKPLAVLVYVACKGEPVPRDEVASLLWPEADRQKGRHSVRQALWVLKNALGFEALEGQDVLILVEGALTVDLHAFNEFLAQGRADDARTLWRGPVLDHFRLAGARHWNHWVEDLRADLERRFGTALLHFAGERRGLGQIEEAAEALDLAVQVSPSSGPIHVARIELFLDRSRLDSAREALAAAQHVLADQPRVTGTLKALAERLDRVVREQRSMTAEGESFPMEFVGRSRELAGLHALWEESLRSQTRVAVVTGPSGIGKTRLARELLLQISGDEAGRVELRGTRGEMKLRWGATSDLVRQLLKLPGSAGISSGSDAWLRAMLPSLGRESNGYPTLNGFSPAATLDAVTDLLEAVTFELPLVLLVDDFQWVDPESRTLFLGLANRCRGLRVLLVFAGRSDLSSRHWEALETVLISEAGARRFTLAPLIEEEVGELLALGAAFTDPDQAGNVVRKIFQASAGNPLFIREILKEIHEKGILEREEEGWRFRTSRLPEEFDLPENIRHLLRQRLERLSEPSATVAAALARARRSVPSETLQAQAGLPPNVFTEAVAELMERGVVEWVDGTRLDFVHDLLRDAADLHLVPGLPDPAGKGHRGTGRRWILGLVAGILLALPLGVLWGSGALPWTSDPESRYGGGVIVFLRQEGGPFFVRARASSPEDWRPERFQPPVPSGTSGIFRGPDGNLVFFGVEMEASGPDMMNILPGGSRVPVFPDTLDQRLMDYYPDGSRVLFVSENPQEEQLFSHSLYEGRLSTGDKTLIYRGHAHLNHAAWSPDGDLIALVAAAERDSLILMSRTAQRVASVTLGDISGISWCGAAIVAASSHGSGAFLVSVTVPEMAVDTVATLVAAGAQPTCSPDGTAVVYVAVVNRRLQPVLFDLTTRTLHPLPEVDGNPMLTSWIPDSHPPVASRIEIEGDDFHVDWGSEVALSASVTFTDGSSSPRGIRWETSDPSVATVSEGGSVTANGLGSCRIVARRGYSLADTVVVEVRDVGGAGAIFHDDFRKLDSARWAPVGVAPMVDTLPGGEPVLRFRGNEKYSDGLVLLDSLPVSQGITVEMEFRFLPDRPVHQNLGVSIRDMNPDPVRLRDGLLEAITGAGIVYPGREMAKFNPDEVRLVVSPGLETILSAPEVLPSSDWVHMALQIRADGECALILNREKIGTSPIVLDTRPRHAWHLALMGDAIGTEILVRNLAVWPGERY